MNISEKSVYHVLASFGEEGLTIREILLALNQRMKKKTQLRKALRKLAENNLCYKKDNHYFLRDPAAEIPAAFRKGGKPDKIRKRTAALQRHPEGIFLNAASKPVILDPVRAERYPVAAGQEKWLLHGDRIRFELEMDKSGKAIALPLEMVRRNITMLKGSLVRTAGRESFFQPQNRALPKRFRVQNPPRKLPSDSREIFFNITDFAGDHRLPEGRIDTSLSGRSAQSAIMAQILSENRILNHFPRNVLQAAAQFPGVVRQNPAEGRRDLRSLPFVTIDGADARDFDDAIHAETDGENFRIRVSIADVSEYVKPGSEIDREALNRGTSTYLPGFAVHMLPPSLSAGLCSLKAGVNRKTVTCEILFDAAGEVLSAEIFQSLNRIFRRLTYDQVDRFFESGQLQVKKNRKLLEDMLGIAARIAEVLEKKRRKRGAIDFQMPETAFAYDPENRVTGIGKVYQTKAMRLIEQFMLEANEAVARFAEKNRIPIMWRNHPAPLPEKAAALRQLFWRNDLEIPSLRKPADFNSALLKCRNHVKRDLLEYSTLRAMSLAEYGNSREGHFGLAATHYCHFTSPIRRYPDLVVHRGIKSFLNRQRPSAVSAKTAIDLSEKERRATAAERVAVKFVKMLFLAGRIGDVMTARVSGFHRSGFFIELKEPYVEGYVSFGTILDDSYAYDERQQLVIGTRLEQEISFAQEMTVMLTGFDRRQFMPEFIWLGWE